MELLSGLEPGTVIGAYRIERLIGRGGMGTVYLAEHLHLERRVALKVLPAELALDPASRERFIRESRLAASLEHPAIVPIYDAAEREGILYIAMRYVQGGDLKQLLQREGSLPPQRALQLLSPVAEGLAAAHAQGLVHRDVKPANILVDQPSERVYISDFGLARLAGGGAITRTGSFLGTVDYCSPEQIEGLPVDARTDVYSLGCVAFQCLSGQPPFVKDSEVAVIKAHLHDPPPALSTVRPGLPRSLDGVIATAMAKYPDVRYATCPQLVEALRQAISADGPVTAATVPSPPAPHVTMAERTKPVSPPPPPPSARRTRRWRWAGAGAALLLAAAVAIVGAVVLTRDVGGSAPNSSAGPPVSRRVSQRLSTTVVPLQRALTNRVAELEASASSFARMESAASALEQEVLRTEGWADSALRPQSPSDRALIRSLGEALAAQASYARHLANLPAGASSLTSKQAQTAIDRSEQAEDAYVRLSGVHSRIPSMPLSRSDHLRLRSFVPQPPVTPTTPTETVPPTPQPSTSVTTFFGRSYSIDYPEGWAIEAADVSKGSYFDTTIRSPIDSRLMLRVDTSPNAPPSVDAAALPVVRALERQSGYQLVDYRPTVFEGYEAIYWEFLVRESGRLLHKVDIFFIDSSGQGYGVLTQAPAEQWASWSSGLQQLRESLVVYDD